MAFGAEKASNGFINSKRNHGMLLRNFRLVVKKYYSTNNYNQTEIYIINHNFIRSKNCNHNLLAYAFFRHNFYNNANNDFSR